MKLIIYLLLCSLIFSASVHAETFNDSMKKWAKNSLSELSIVAKKIKKGGKICGLGTLGSIGKVITRISDNGRSNGLKPGDTLVQLNGEQYDEKMPHGYLIRQFSPGEKVSITVLRNGAELNLEGVCADVTRYYQIFLKMLQAAAKGKWQECVDQSYEVERESGVSTAYIADLRMDCSEARRCAKKNCKPVSFADAQLAYQYYFLGLEEISIAAGNALDAFRPEILSGITWLEQSGFPRLAADIESRLRSAESADTQAIAKSPAPSQPISTQGTCFAVTDLEVLTSQHVVFDANFITVIFADGREIVAEIKQQSRSTDLALLTLYEKTPAILPLAAPRSLTIGQEIFTLGFPVTAILGEDAKFTEGTVSSLSGIQGDATYFQMSVPVQPGNSGGPVVNMQGEVVGIVAATAAIESFYTQTGALPQNVNWASKSDYARMMFDPPPALNIGPVSRTEAIDKVSSALCKVMAVRN